MTDETNRHATSTGSARLRFHCMGQPIAGLRFRLRMDSGEVHAGRSDAEGRSHLLAFGPASREELSADTVWLPAECDATAVSIEIRRDDGSWKTIGQFRLDARRHKEISAEANAYALPFQLGRVTAPLAGSAPSSMQDSGEHPSSALTQALASPLQQDAVYAGSAATAMPATYPLPAPSAYTAFPQVLAITQQPNGVLVSSYQVPSHTHWVTVALRMPEGSGTSSATLLPYVLVHSSPDLPGQWHVMETGITPRGSARIRLRIVGLGQYRLYIKEPGVRFTEGDTFTIPQHTLTNGLDSGREVQPIYAITVTAGTQPQTLTVTRELPNTLDRPADTYDVPGGAVTLTSTHINQNNAYDLGGYRISLQHWADISRAYGPTHPIIAASPVRSVLENIYRERLTNTPTALARTLTFDDVDRRIEFDPQATEGGRQRLSFLLDNGTATNKMTSDEVLRRTHPIVMEFWLLAMQAMDIRYARVTGVWRPHTGSTRHRYASALDLADLHTRVGLADGTDAAVEIYLNLARDNARANPRRETTVPAEIRKRDFSMAFHRYLAEQKQAMHLGWLGGPWPLTYAQVGLAGTNVFMETNAAHENHVHLSIGTDQP